MSNRSNEAHRERWEARGRKVARQVNLAWWMETLSAPMLVAALIGAAGLLVIRREIEAAAGWPAGVAAAGIVILLGTACWLVARRKFETPEQALVRIEAAMHLRNGLTAARAGVAPWPSPPAEYHAGLKWHWPRLLAPSLGALALWASGVFIPVIARGQSGHDGPGEPQAWSQLDSELAHLAREEVVDEKYIEETRKKLEELRSQKEEQWFSHSSLEATDSLKKAHRSEAERLEQALDKAENALKELEENAAALGQEQKDRLLDQLDEAMQGLQNGAMKPNPQLLEQLKQLDPKNPGKLDPTQMEQLRENMRRHAEAMKNAKGEEGGDWTDELLSGDSQGDCEGGNCGDDCGDDCEQGRGDGGVGRGGEHSPGVLGRERERLDSGDLTGLEAADLSRALPGDLLELQSGEHDVNESPARITEGGALDGTGSGGDRVWRDSLDPAEQGALKRFFE